MVVSSEEATKALELMPVGLLESDEDEGEVRRLEAIKHTTNSLRKLSYPGHFISGHGGIEEATPHAMQMEQSINELDAISNAEKALAFKKSTAGTALKNANLALSNIRQQLVNEDSNSQEAGAV